MIRRATLMTVLLVFALAAALMASATPVSAGDSPDPVGIPGDASAFGRTYGEWSAAWWQWGYELPDENHPVVTEGPVDCSYGQSGRVWFLAGTTGGDVERSCRIPVGKPLFYPILNVSYINSEPNECGRPEGCTVEEKRDVLTWLFDTFPCNFYSTVDGVPTVQIRTQSPPFPVVTNNNVFVGPGITDDEVVSEGAWVLLPPLSRGKHTIEFGGSLCDPESGEAFWSVGATYDLTVVPKSRW